MGHKFAEIAFTETIREIQTELGSRDGYASMDGELDYNHLLSEVEAQFIVERDSFYMATVSETGWPYVQHRGGPSGFIKVIDDKTIGFSDYAGNRQYVSTGNLRKDDRVSLFFMDYPNRRRLKILGRVSQVASDDLETLSLLEDENYRAPVERAFIINIEAFDWNCPKYITPRYTDADINAVIEPLQSELEQLRTNNSKPDQILENITRAPDEIGNGPLALIISAIRQEAENIRSYELRHPEGKALPSIEAGAHIQVPVMMANGETVWRFYSITSDPNQSKYYQIAVLNQPNGRGGSKTLHKQYQVGMVLGCYRPDNYFGLQETSHEKGDKAVFIAGGIGITPIRSMVMTAKQKGYDYEVHYAARNRKTAAFLDEFEANSKHYISSDDIYLDIASVLNKAEPNTIHYLCGPPAMIEDARNIAKELKLSPSAIVFEAFDE